MLELRLFQFLLLGIDMVSSKQCYAKWGDPAANESKFMVPWDVPVRIQMKAVPKRIYCNKLMCEPLANAFNNIITRNLAQELRTWDGCFNIRKKRGSASASLHSWGIAIDINAAWNGFGKPPTISSELVKCFTDAGFAWGGAWSRPDGMHFELKEI